jgi:hypothetical protein
MPEMEFISNRPIHHSPISGLIGLLFAFQALIAPAQNVSFVASADTKEAMVGVPFEVTFTLSNAEGQRFTPPDFRDFKQDGLVSESRGMSIINGRSSSKQSWSYTLSASKPGHFTLGSATVQVAGKSYSTPPINITVLSAPPAAKGGAIVPPGKDDQVFIVGTLSSSKVYLGQQIAWRLTLFTRVAIEGADLISLPDFSGFYSKEKRRFDTRTNYQTIRGKKYAVKVLHEEALFPQSTGEITIGAAQIRAGIETAASAGYIFGAKPVTLTSQPVTLMVEPLPDPAPETFTGGVGRYEWSVSVDSTSLSTDDALTLKVSLKGNGDSRRFAAPKISVPPTCEIFEPRILEEEEYESEQEVLHTKTLEYVVLPKEPGSHEITPTLSYFDADSNKYCTLSAAVIRFNVTAGPNYKPPGTAPTPESITQPREEVSWLDKISGFLAHPYLWATMALSALGIGIFMILRNRKKTKPQEETHLVPHSPKNQRTTEQIFSTVSSLLNSGQPETFYKELLKTLQSYISSRLSLPTAQLNHTDLRLKMAEKHITPIRAQAFLSILQTCEQAVYSGYIDANNMESDWRTAQTVIQELEKEMR